MDKNFLEFWGNYFLNAARGQESVERLAEWMGRGLTGSDDLTAMFRKVYGLEGSRAGGAGTSAAWEAAVEKFRESFKTYLDLFDVVPGAEHRALQEKNDRLEEKVAALTEKIKALQASLSESRAAGGDIAGEFGALIERQAEEFKALTDNFQEFFTTASDTKKE